jgi:hypothetical protein
MDQELRWFHVVVSTYGSWLHGDARGFRTRHHRQHIEGDYKNPPPPGRYEHLERNSRNALTQPPVVFTPEQRALVGAALRDKLQRLGALVLCVSASGQHAHILAKMPPRLARTWVGHAKRHIWFELRDRGWVGQVWGKRSKEKPVRDRQHQLNAYHYILNHANEGAWVWSLMDKKPEKE